MPPKKTRAQAEAGSSQPAASRPRETRSASREPAPAPETRQTRAGRKRRLSDASNASSVATPGTTPSKRRKRVKVPAEKDHDMLEEVPEVMEEEDELAIDTEAGAEIDPPDTVEKSVRFSEALDEDIEEMHEGDTSIHVNFDEKFTATHMTPHPHRATIIKRRITASSLIGGSQESESKRSKHTSTRHSLPSVLSQQLGDSYTYVEEHEFAPLSEILKERIQKRTRIYQLYELLSAQKKQGNEEKVQTIQTELAGLIQSYRQTSAGEGAEEVDMFLDEDMPVLASQREVAYPELPVESQALELAASPGTSLAVSGRLSLSQSQFRSKEEQWDEERKRFADHIESLSNQATKATSKLKVLECEVSGLGFGLEGVDTLTVLASIRQSFNEIRERMQIVLPDSLPDNASNEDILEVTVANVEEFAKRLRVADRELQEKINFAAELSNQVQGLVDHLADAQIRYNNLHEKWGELDRANEDKERENEDILESLQQAEEDRDTTRAELEAKQEEFDVLKNENVDFANSVDRLTASLQHYRNEETRLQNLVSKMEEEHKATVANMNKEREETVRDLEDRLDTQYQSRKKAEEMVQERQRIIDGLEIRVDDLESERDQLRQQLLAMTDERDEQRDACEAAEADLQQKDDHIQDLETRVNRLEKELSELHGQIEELRGFNETERSERQALETELDERCAELEETNEKLREKGTEANELRQKLFEIQQRKEKEIKELEEKASERDEQYQQDIAEEVERREEAEERSQQHTRTIDELEARLEEVEDDMRTQLAERDQRISDLEDTLAEKNSELEELRDNLEAAQAESDEHAAQKAQQKEEAEARIHELEASIAERESEIRNMQTEAEDAASLHDSEIEDRDRRIAEFNHDVTRLQDEVAQLQKHKASLEQRVTEEAEQFLGFQGEKFAEIESLKAALEEKQHKIEVVVEKNETAERVWQENLEAKDEEITSLHREVDENYSTISSLRTNMASIKHLFEAFVEKANAKMAEIHEERRAELQKIHVDSQELQTDGFDALRQLDDLAAWEGELQTEHTAITTTKLEKSQAIASQSRRKTRGRKKRVMDSGVGMDETMISDSMLQE
ncbi:Hypothetical predicted protein [Lecanosticta acicola]|uniref:Uncharacterized protein n=1 Tax=Lecanosticta acicola TaxID=111012 RepID=A0AAI8Z7L1_9PEZI|nr:Hypothetical predicted protein [Lecanosticta acicola]